MENKLDFTPAKSMQTKPNRLILPVSKCGHFFRNRTTARRALSLDTILCLLTSAIKSPLVSVVHDWVFYTVIMNNCVLFPTHLICLIKKPPGRPQAKQTEGEQSTPNTAQSLLLRLISRKCSRAKKKSNTIPVRENRQLEARLECPKVAIFILQIAANFWLQVREGKWHQEAKGRNFCSNSGGVGVLPRKRLMETAWGECNMGRNQRGGRLVGRA